ncbi:hypothetical protein L3X38_004898 [Prunus dulcis]|uniref:Uncharacterized protein n=1 Tax=Prunus dulcis TaxID=3755 RepID=A0AAD5F3K9_PRUDU|nr:hypothetical protein L3X38_004898 [Prunus dulcis]
MNALPVESPATLRRQTAGPLEQAGTNGFEELGLGLRFRLVELSVSVRIGKGNWGTDWERQLGKAIGVQIGKGNWGTDWERQLGYRLGKAIGKGNWGTDWERQLGYRLGKAIGKGNWGTDWERQLGKATGVQIGKGNWGDLKKMKPSKFLCACRYKIRLHQTKELEACNLPIIYGQGKKTC